MKKVININIKNETAYIGNKIVGNIDSKGIVHLDKPLYPSTCGNFLKRIFWKVFKSKVTVIIKYDKNSFKKD